MSDYDSKPDTLEHIRAVRKTVGFVTRLLSARALNHDQSKLLEPEKSVFDSVTPRLRGLTYGSDEYKASLADMQVALDHHYANNPHHPEHFVHGVDDMTIIDIVELFCDWCAATHRHEDGDIFKSIEHNTGRFQLSDQLRRIFENTAKMYQMGKRSQAEESKT
jgi:hypothetical protein